MPQTASIQTGKRSRADRPSVVMIFIDDMGYGDPSCYGGQMIPTPGIDRLAAEGIRFTQGYVTATICGPSRAGLLSGCYQQRFGMQNNMDRRKYRIPDAQRIMPAAFREAGYKTAAVGKWNIIVPPEQAVDEMHLRIDWEADFWPIQDGPRAGEYIGVDEERYDETRAKKVDSSKTPYWGPVKEGDVYLTDLIGYRAVSFIERNQNDPFMLYLAFNAVHTPLQAKKEYESRVMHLEPEPLRMYASMFISADEVVARVLDKLDELGLADNTVIALLSDNGPAMAPIRKWRPEWPDDPVLFGSTGGLRGYKGNYYEGGIRIPYIMRWPAKWKGGQVSDMPVNSLDLYPTFCDAAGVPTPEGTQFDGVSLLPYLDGTKADRPHEAMYWMQDHMAAIRMGDHKLILGHGDGTPQLFDLSADPRETTDLSQRQPDLARRLETAWREWAKQMPPAANLEWEGRSFL